MKGTPKKENTLEENKLMKFGNKRISQKKTLMKSEILELFYFPYRVEIIGIFKHPCWQTGIKRIHIVSLFSMLLSFGKKYC